MRAYQSQSGSKLGNSSLAVNPDDVSVGALSCPSWNKDSRCTPEYMSPEKGVPAPERGPGALPCLIDTKCIESVCESEGAASGYHWKNGVAMRENIKGLAGKYGRDRIGMLTITFPADVTTKVEAEKRMKSFRTNVMAERYQEWIRVYERGKLGGIHYHIAVVCPGPVSNGFDFKAFAEAQHLRITKGRCPEFYVQHNKYVKSASRWLRGEWKFLRDTSKKYGLGRHELLPVRSCSGAGAYLGKYLSKGSTEDPRDKGCRRVEYSQGARAWSSKFSWNSPNGREWRYRVKYYAESIGVYDYETLVDVLQTERAIEIERGGDPPQLVYMLVARANGCSPPQAEIDAVRRDEDSVPF